jgi:choline kinase
MIGLVLAAGPGRRLQPLTETVPKTLLPLNDGRTILDLALRNLRSVGLEEVVIVTGFAAQRVQERVPELERRYDLRIDLLFNDRAEEWNNAYSLWLAREAFSQGLLLVNGDTVHPPSIENGLIAARGADILLAVDREKPLGAEEMKTLLAPDGSLRRINKDVHPADAQGEYVGLALVEPAAAERLAVALETTWRRDPSLYYEDGFQEFVDRGGRIEVLPIGGVPWVEVDDHADLERAREIECRY